MQTNSQKYLGSFLDTQSDFAEHMTIKFIKANKSLALLESLKTFFR